MVYKCFDKNSKRCGANIEVKPSKKLTEELRKSIIRKF